MKNKWGEKYQEFHQQNCTTELVGVVETLDIQTYSRCSVYELPYTKNNNMKNKLSLNNMFFL